MAEIQTAREAAQPIRARTGGSTFANPPGHQAWRLIDEAGCRGLRRGGAMVSEKHTNFLINTGDATAADIEGLGEEVRRRVLDQFGVTLEWEIRRIGVRRARHGGCPTGPGEGRMKARTARAAAGRPRRQHLATAAAADHAPPAARHLVGGADRAGRRHLRRHADPPFPEDRRRWHRSAIACWR